MERQKGGKSFLPFRQCYSVLFRGAHLQYQVVIGLLDIHYIKVAVYTLLLIQCSLVCWLLQVAHNKTKPDLELLFHAAKPGATADLKQQRYGSSYPPLPEQLCLGRWKPC